MLKIDGSRLKILFAVQGTGNGHTSRAKEVLPILQTYADVDVDVLISGTQNEITLNADITYSCYGLGFVFGKKGGVDIKKTLKQMRFFSFLREVLTLPVRNYDLVINDFEPVSAWACRLYGVKCVALSHQSAMLSEKTPLPKRIDWFGNAILKHYAPSNSRYSFHFKPYDRNIFTPVIRKDVREMEATDQGHITVYLPSYDDEKLLKLFQTFPDQEWVIFSKRAQKRKVKKNCVIHPINGEVFSESMASATGIVCGAGFETPAEALYLGKKLLVIPMKGQFEQQCNAAALKKMRVKVLKKLGKKQLPKLKKWLCEEDGFRIEYPDITEDIVVQVLTDHIQSTNPIKESELAVH